MKFYHLNAPGPYYTNSFLLISEAGHGVVTVSYTHLSRSILFFEQKVHFGPPPAF